MANEITGYNIGEIDLSPATTLDEVIRNVAIIISTTKGTVPLARDFGISNTFIDRPLAIAKALLVSEVSEAITQFEPRAEIVNMRIEEDAENPGRLIPIVEVKVKDEQ